MPGNARELVQAAALALAIAGSAVQARAQGVPSATADSATPPIVNPSAGSSPFLLDPGAQIEGDRIKRETYRSQPAGQNQNWNLDIGRFQPQVDDDPNQLADDLKENYSGMRLRLPFRGGTER